SRRSKKTGPGTDCKSAASLICGRLRRHDEKASGRIAGSQQPRGRTLCSERREVNNSQRTRNSLPSAQRPPPCGVKSGSSARWSSERFRILNSPPSPSWITPPRAPAGRCFLQSETPAPPPLPPPAERAFCCPERVRGGPSGQDALARLAAADHRQDPLAVHAERRGQTVEAGYGRVVDQGDQVAGLEPGRRRRRSPFHREDLQAVRDGAEGRAPRHDGVGAG